MTYAFISVLTFVASVSLSNGLGAQSAQPRAGNEPIRERALIALNAFEAWAFMYTPMETSGAPPGHIHCEPGPSSLPHACHPGTIPACVSCGIFMHSFDSVTTDKNLFLAAEKRMLATLDSAAAANPSDEMLVGTLVFMLARRGLHADAERSASAPRCVLRPEVRCQLFRAYAHQAAGRTISAMAVFDSVLTRLPENERCALADVSPLLDASDREAQRQLPCRELASGDSAFWWLSDPSLLLVGNDRLTEHLARAVGNRILMLYRAARSTVGGVIWYAGAVPRTDSVRRFKHFLPGNARSGEPWSWHSELTRFGMSDAMEIIPGKRRWPAREFHFPGGVHVLRKEGLGETQEEPYIVCRPGFEAGTLLVRETTGMHGVPLKGSPHEPLYPTYAFDRYRWSEPGAASCARMYNTTAQHQFTPLSRVAADPFTMTPDSWEIGGVGELTGGAPYREQYTPRYAPVTSIDEFQIARLPRGDSMLVLAVMHHTGDGLDVARNREGARQWESALIATSSVPPKSPGDIIVVRSQSETFTQRNVFTGMMPASSIFAALEILTPDTVGFARTRTGVPISPWLEREARLSDIVYFRPDTNSPAGAGVTSATLESIMPLALHSLSVPRGQELGLYWETQAGDLPPAASTAGVTLTVESVAEERGFLGRLVGGLFGGRQGVRVIKWSLPLPSTAGGGTVLRWGNSIRIPTNSLEVGEYLIALEMDGISRGAAPITQRSLTVTRRQRQ